MRLAAKGVKRRLPGTIIALGVVSFFTDFSSEMIYPLLPVFLTNVLGAGVLALGIIEGAAESISAFLKIVSGTLTDRTARRKSFILSGYSISGLVRPLIGLASIWQMVFAIRFLDRIGKGIRTSPRDALIADVTESNLRGAAYGFHRSMDHAGAVVGPLAAAALLTIAGFSLRTVFLLAIIPSIVVIIVLIKWVREPSKTTEKFTNRSGSDHHSRNLGKDYKILLSALLIFTLGNSTDAFLLLRLSNVGVPVAWVAVLWSLHHVVKMVATYFGGIFSDRCGHQRLILMGWIIYALIYFLFAIVESSSGLIAIFLAYGLYFGFTEPAEKALVSVLAPAQSRGTAFGYYHGIIGLGALPASIVFGFLWHNFSSSVAFFTGAGLSICASVILLFITPNHHNK